MRGFKRYMLGVIVLSGLWAGCASTKVTRVQVEKPIDLSGQWNDYDGRLVSQEVIKNCLEAPWLTNFMKEKGRNPVVIVGHVENRSHEHINTRVFTTHLEKELINSGKVIFVASPEERVEIRQEREDQHQGYTDRVTMAEIGKERGADYMLIGSVNSVKDEVKGKYAILYQVNFELIHLTTNEKSWIGQKEIKKMVENAKFSL
ncbi:MAG: hypothetical protein A2Z81_03640 [Omnitrophica WOR_2 bacterium GWA2_45_18]|nr:MAG: hypothetical protein A2Z81_03640 [Omnitrophica WOR_2 bacterium GWA2_45_18]